MPSYKLYYFNITALGEPIRFLLSYGGADFEDVRVEREQWPDLKPKMPMGQMPVLEIDGKQTHQSLSISRYLGKEFKIAGANDLEALEIDIAADTVNDFRQKIGAVHYESNEVIKAEKAKVLNEEQFPFYLEKLDALAAKNNGYLATGKLSWADLYFVSLLDYLNGMAKKDVLATAPNLQKVRDHVNAVPQIKAYLEKRPKTDI